MKRILEYTKFNGIQEDKVLKFSEYDPIKNGVKYNGTILLDQFMIWLRNELEKDDSIDTLSLSLDDFLDKTKINKEQFLTFVGELHKTNRVENFDIEINGDNVIFSNLKQKMTVEDKNVK